MFVTGAPGRRDAGVQCGSGFFGASELRQKLAILEISRDVIRMRSQERLEILDGGGSVAGIGALHRQTIACKRIRGLCGDEVLQDLASRLLLWLGRGHAHSIFALARNAKYPKEREPSYEIAFHSDEIENSPGGIAAGPAGQRLAH